MRKGSEGRAFGQVCVVGPGRDGVVESRRVRPRFPAHGLVMGQPLTSSVSSSTVAPCPRFSYRFGAFVGGPAGRRAADRGRVRMGHTGIVK